MEKIHQGDILKIDKIKNLVFVASKDFFNQSGEIVACPIFEENTNSPLHIFVSTEDYCGYVQCEKLALLDLKIRGYKKVSRISLKDVMDVVDAIQGIFDYI